MRPAFACLSVCLAAPLLHADEPRSAITLTPDEAAFTIVRKVPVADCRAVRGFLGTPVDGSVRSWDYRGRVREYPNTASDGVVYSYNDNDGLHMTLADPQGFDAIVLRGGARASAYADVATLVQPEAQDPLWQSPGEAAWATAHFDRRVRAGKVSFFGVEGGTVADVGFYRVEKGKLPVRDLERWMPTAEPVALARPESRFAPQSLYLAMNERYAEDERHAVQLLPAGGPTQPVTAQQDRALHFLTPPLTGGRGLAAVALEAQVSAPPGPLSFIAAVQDPLDPRLDLLWAEFAAPGPGRIRVVFDIPDQVLLDGSRLWLTLRFGREVVLAGPQGGGPAVWLQLVPRQAALPQALARRKRLLKTFFSLLSEPRPWGAYRQQSREEFYASSQYARQCPELFMTIDQCHALDPSDDMVRQYREWVYLRNLERLSEISPPPSPPVGVPAWAWYPRLAWLDTRRIAQWWLDERLVPTGEFGGRVGDDSDLYQQFADLPFFESAGAAAQVLDSAARMAELADRENLRGGLNIHTTDSLHAYEEGINHLALMARWFYGDPIYLERCMDSARNMEHLTIVTPDGRRHFRDGQRMGAEDVEKPRQPAVEGHSTPLMWHTAFQVADYNRNPRTLKVLREWADSWLRFQRPGQWATAVEVLTGKVVAWQKDRPLYGGYRTQATTFTWLYGLTGDARYLEPFLHYYRQGQAPYPADGFLGDAHALGAITDLDDATLGRLATQSPALALYLTGDAQPLVQATIGSARGWQAEISNLYDARRWPDMYTVTHQFTDRVFPSLLQHASLAYLGGFCRRNKFNPTLAVSWEGFATDYAALVLANQRDRLKVAVYSFAEAPVTGKMRVWALEHGTYNLATGRDGNGDNEMDRSQRTETLELRKADAIELTLAPRAVTVVSIEQERKLDSIFRRPDLALAAREVQLAPNAITGTLHNIGSADVNDVVVGIVDAGGRVAARQSLGVLAAPTDLVPRRLPFTLRLPAKRAKGWRLVLDPDGRVPEIYEGNNEVTLDDLPAVNYAQGWE